MLLDKLKNVRVILGSQSPRRKELLAKMGIDFMIVVKETDETYDAQQNPEDIVKHIARNKLMGFHGKEFEDALVIAADTVVVHRGEVLGKPRSVSEAVSVLQELQGQNHQVLTAVALQYRGLTRCFVEETLVEFSKLTAAEIDYYVEQYPPLDKAGSYGIQDWIGIVGVKAVTGSYENVVGLPTARLYQELKQLV
ncbi:Maf family protein [Sphingobacterium suaedae]|uniref:dTTP/UTP pyrophosphatase n=1 Tax=Sphingobacterium suaedae TaxID=1686402 RepID=A0ABW5KKV3_9SPHI